MFVEGQVQAAAGALPGLIGLLGLLYLTLHLIGHRRVPALAPSPAARRIPGRSDDPADRQRARANRLRRVPDCAASAAGAWDRRHDLRRSASTSITASISSLYNPFAAVPSMHVGYAVIVGASLVLHRQAPLALRARASLSGARPVRGRGDRQPLHHGRGRGSDGCSNRRSARANGHTRRTSSRSREGLYPQRNPSGCRTRRFNSSRRPEPCRGKPARAR